MSEIFVWGLGALSIILLILLMVSASSNRQLQREIDILREVMKGSEKPTEKVETVSEECFEEKGDESSMSDHEKVILLLEQGESIPTISQKLGIPENQIELIIKFDKIKKDHNAP